MKKGFTLVEIILSILLITIIGISGFFVYKADKKEKTLEKMKEDIYRAANVLIETDSETKEQLYNSKNGAIIPLKKLESEGLIDFNGLNIEDEYVLSMLGSNEESEKCSGTLYNIGSWTKATDDVIYICGGSSNGGSGSPNVLKDAIIFNAENADGYTSQTVLDDKNILFYENRLVKNDGEYIFTGNTEDNYVTFNNMCFRIIKIQKDGSIKLLLQDNDSTCNGANYDGSWSIGQGHFGYTHGYLTDSNGNKTTRELDYANYFNSDDKENSMKDILDEWFDYKFVGLESKLKEDDWTITDTSTGYMIWDYDKYIETTDDRVKLLNEYIVGVGTVTNIKYTKTETFSSYVGTIYSTDYQPYMIQNGLKAEWPTLSVAYGNNIYDAIHYVDPVNGIDKSTEYIAVNGVPVLLGKTCNAKLDIRPAIVLKPNTKISSGNGTQVRPYIVE